MRDASFKLAEWLMKISLRIKNTPQMRMAT